MLNFDIDVDAFASAAAAFKGLWCCRAVVAFRKDLKTSLS